MDAGSLFIFLLILIYFLPTICAYSRGHHNKDPIFILNIFLGWTLIGWVASLVWAFTANTQNDSDEESENNNLSTKSNVEQLSELIALHKSGAITNDEFAVMKTKIIKS